jgi:4-hydroxy-4-methyl-2-oxoglutarate aldolase
MSLSSIINDLREFDTALLANTIGYIDPTPAYQYYMGGSIQSVTPTLGPTVGVAVTCEMDSSTPEGAPNFDKYYEQLEQIAAMEEPVVWVVKTVGSRPDHECILGDGMAKELYSAGCIGAVTDGGVRDINGLLTVPFADYSRGKTIHHCAYRFPSINKPVEVGGITVQTGDVIHANGEGVIKIPKGCLKDLAAKATDMYAFERDAHQVLRRIDPNLSSSSRTNMLQELLKKRGFEKSGDKQIEL